MAWIIGSAKENRASSSRRLASASIALLLIVTISFSGTTAKAGQGRSEDGGSILVYLSKRGAVDRTGAFEKILGASRSLNLDARLEPLNEPLRVRNVTGDMALGLASPRSSFIDTERLLRLAVPTTGGGGSMDESAVIDSLAAVLRGLDCVETAERERVYEIETASNEFARARRRFGQIDAVSEPAICGRAGSCGRIGRYSVTAETHGSNKGLCGLSTATYESGTNDPLSERQWGMYAVGAFRAWQVTRGESDVVVAIIDTGCDTDHQDLRGQLWVNRLEAEGTDGVDDDGNGYIDDLFGYDFVTVDSSQVFPGEDGAPADGDPFDFSGHGTHVAGIIGAAADNSAGIAGLAPRCRMMVLRAGYRAADGSSRLMEGDILAAIDYAVTNGADVINMSFGGGDSELLRRSLEYAYDRGIVLVAAAGNYGTDDATYPASYDFVLSVGAVDSTGRRASFSPSPDAVDCFAPGVSIVSTFTGGTYEDLSGTSQATPFVSATAALVKSVHAEWSSREIAAQITNTAVPLDGGPARVCRADRSLYEVAEESIAYEGIESGVFDEEDKRLVLKVRFKNEWRPLDRAEISVEPLDSCVSVAGESIASFEGLESGEEFEAAFELALSKTDSMDSIGILLHAATDDSTFTFRDTFRKASAGDIEIEDFEITEIEGDGDGALDKGESGELTLRLVNRGSSVSTLKIDLAQRQWPIIDISPAEISKIIEPSDTSSVVLNFTVAEERNIPHEAHVKIGIQCGGCGMNYEVPVFISYEGEGGEDEEVCFQNSSSHTGFFPSGGGSPVSVLWKVSLVGAGKSSPQPIVMDDVCFVGSSDESCGRIAAFSAEEGRPIWERKVSDSSRELDLSMAGYRGILYFSCGSTLEALKGADGERIWRFDASSTLSAGCRVSAPTIYEGLVVAGVHEAVSGGRDRLVALDAFTGQPLWIRTFEENEYIPPFPPVCLDGNVAVVDYEGKIESFSAATGELLWATVAGEAPAFPLVAIDTIVVSVGLSGEVRGVSLRDGSIAWSARCGDHPLGPPCTVPMQQGVDTVETMAMVSSTDEGAALFLLGLDGRMLERIDLCGIEPSGVVATKEHIYAAGKGGSLYAIDTSTLVNGGDAVIERFDASLYQSKGDDGEVAEDTAPGTPFISGRMAYVVFQGNTRDALVSFALEKDDAAEQEAPIPLALTNFPNPFNPSTRIAFSIARASDVEVGIYDSGGRCVCRFYLKGCMPGRHEVEWDGKNDHGRIVSSGVYFCKVKAGTLETTRKLVLVK